ncbi:MAG: hypothetical protein COV72_03845 [Candidatus Omnitrophica bacterium CG11_big_fil_rev_8_21_14_0_20_42_13]|uniref:Uncharacterized protein n=1 Tax=Candidatus Ghiorseimicrobium undicola TaxID=1974746 RepID=A0A2H0M054_9BACT|nr:MAG: hypothetical protein COV72_03845 [Candidatus Omnitrophica bacterium CG11_big_fil_rev_8_21_14_0_20_42_13]
MPKSKKKSWGLLVAISVALLFYITYFETLKGVMPELFAYALFFGILIIALSEWLKGIIRDAVRGALSEEFMLIEGHLREINAKIKSSADPNLPKI